MKKIFCAAIVTALLTACGGGGSQGEKSVHTPPTHQYTFKPKVVNENVLLIEDKRIELAKAPKGMQTYALKFGKQMQVYNQDYTTLGYVLPKPANANRLNQLSLLNVSADDSIIVAHPLAFDRLPKKGDSIYEGISFSPNSQGKVGLYVNFDKKTVGGGIHSQKAHYGENPKDILLADTELKKHILESTEIHFAGVAIQDGKRLGYGGMFAGPTAEEVIGVVTDNTRKVETGFIGKRTR